jgi:hypothetical protein
MIVERAASMEAKRDRTRKNFNEYFGPNMNAKKAIAKLIEGKLPKKDNSIKNSIGNFGKPLSPAQKKAASSKADALFAKKKGKEFPGGKKQITGVGTGRINPKWSKAWDRGMVENEEGQRYEMVVQGWLGMEEDDESAEMLMRALSEQGYTLHDGEPWGDSDTIELLTIDGPANSEARLIAFLKKYYRDAGNSMNARHDQPFGKPAGSAWPMKKDGSYGKVTMPGRKRATVIRDPSMPKWRFDKEKKKK